MITFAFDIGNRFFDRIQFKMDGLFIGSQTLERIPFMKLIKPWSSARFMIMK